MALQAWASFVVQKRTVEIVIAMIRTGAEEALEELGTVVVVAAGKLV